MWPNREHFWVSRSWIYRKQPKQRQSQTWLSFILSSHWSRAIAKAEVMKNLIQRLQKKRPSREFFQRSRTWIYRKNLKQRQSQSWLSFLISSKVYEEPYPARIKEHRLFASKNLRADLSKFLTEIWSSLSQCDWIRRIFKRVGLSKYSKNLKKRQP